VVIHHARFPIGEDLFTPYEVIGQLGARPLPVYVARQSALAIGAAQLVVAEHFPLACKTGSAATGSDLRREARRISTLANPHLARVRDVAVRGDDLVVFGDFIDGEKLTAFWRSGEWLPLEIALRILLDVLTGVGALHALRDSNQQPMKLTHGEISPATILFGSDGVGRVLHAVARRAVDARPEAVSVAYLAPEVHTNDAHDGRADVFSVGVLLWEILEGKCLSGDGEEAAGLRVRSGPLPTPSFPEKSLWAKALVPVVTKALAAAPEDRWATAAAMAAEIRKAAGLKLAAASAAAAFAKSKFSERARARRARWETRASERPAPMASAGPGAAVASASAPVPWIAVESPGPVAAAPGFMSGRAAPSAAGRPPVSIPAPPSSTGLFDVALAESVGMAFGRDEELSSSALESYRPPPRVPPDPAAVARADAADVLRLEPPSVAPRDSALPAPPAGQAAHAGSIAERPPSAEALAAFEAPVVFDEVDVAPMASPLGDPSPVPPAISPSDAPAGSRSRRRPLILGGVVALGIAGASLVAVRASHHAPPLATMVAAAASPAVTPTLASAAPPPLTPASAAPVTVPAPQPAASAGATAATAPVHAAKTKTGPKPKAPGGSGSHAKSGPVRPQTRSKPGST
jgi:hypothetical protein